MLKDKDIWPDGALVNALFSKYKHPSWDLLEKYKDQLEKFVRKNHGGKLPKWWSTAAPPLSQWFGAAALVDFRDACIKAAA